METRELICIGCPMGCPLTVEIRQKEVRKVSGNTCPRGEAYARKEVTDPRRIVTTTVGVEGGVSDRVPVKTKEDIPKEKIFACIRALKDLRVRAPISAGEVIVGNVAGTGVDVVATKEVPAE